MRDPDIADPDIAEFLDRSAAYVNINALEPDWEQEFVNAVDHLRNEGDRTQFRRGFAKSVLGGISALDYEHATGWDFDSDDEFREHLRHSWRLFYGDADPQDSL